MNQSHVSSRNWKRREMRRHLVKCPVTECHLPGLHSCSGAYGIQYTGQDGVLLMCDEHFAELMPVYRTYKDIESRLNDLLRSFIDVYIQSHTDRAADFHDQLHLAINAREKFQSRLNAEIRAKSKGHAYWLSSLISRVNFLEEIINGKTSRVYSRRQLRQNNRTDKESRRWTLAAESMVRQQHSK